MEIEQQPHLVVNSIITPDGTVLTSQHRHDYVTHTDANGITFSVDGGTSYIRRGYGFTPKYINLCKEEVDYIQENNIYYDLLSGRFTSNGEYIDNTIVKGYRRVYLGGQGAKHQYPAHRLIYQFIGIDINDVEIDHINNIRYDNRYMNLRFVDNIQNQHNTLKRCDNTSGYKGVSKHKGKWVGRCQLNGKRYYTKYFNNIEDANDALMTIRLDLHDIYANNGEFSNNDELKPLFIENSVYDTDDYEIIRARFERGGRGKDGKQPLTYVPLMEMSNKWLVATIQYCLGTETVPQSMYDPKSKKYHPVIALYQRELKYREEHDIIITDN